MKNLFIYSGIALVVLTNSENTWFEANKKVETSKVLRKEMVAATVFKTEFSNAKNLSTLNHPTSFQSKSLYLGSFSKFSENKTIVGEEPIELFAIHKTDKTTEELFAEDNLITENNISNETQALDFDIINGNTISFECFEPINISKTEKTADQLIAEDNAITENNISNELQALDFTIINKISNTRN
jgi:hypothetical protein